LPEKITINPLPRPSQPTPFPPTSPESSKTERKYQNIPYDKLVSSARWGLESNGLEITDLLNPEPKTTKLIGTKAKLGTTEVLIIDHTPEIIVQVKPIGLKKNTEAEFLVAFWEKLEIEIGIQTTNVEKEFENLRKGDYRTYHMTGRAKMDIVVEQARWGLEDFGMKITESLRPDPMNASIRGAGKLRKQKAEALVMMKGHHDLVIVQLSHTLKLRERDVEELKTIAGFWDKFHNQFGDSLEEETQRDRSRKIRSAEDTQVFNTLTEVWNKLAQKDSNLASRIAGQESDPARIDAATGPLKILTSKYISWPLVPVFQRALFPAKGQDLPILVDISYIKIEEVPAHPAIFAFLRVGPNPISKELAITDKHLFTYEGMEFTDEMGRHLNSEEPLLIKYLGEAYSEESLTHYYAELSIKDKDGSKYSKVLDYYLKEPVRIFNALVGDTKRMVIIARAFLSPDGKIAPQPSLFLRLMDQLVANLDRYCTKLPPAGSPGEAGVSKPAVEVALSRCPYCNWLLTPGKTVCPMCRKELPIWKAEIIPPPSPPITPEGDLLQPRIVEPPPLAVAGQPPAPSGTDVINQRIQEITFQITGLQGVLNDLQAAFTSGRIKFEQYQASNDQYVQQISKLQEEKRALERKKFQVEFQL
jgi:hypothetical protein